MPLIPLSQRGRSTAGLVVLGLAGWLAACGAVNLSAPPCLTDSDCAEGLVCFADGCGDPTQGIAAEVNGGSTVGLFPQDFEIPLLGTTQDFDIKGPLAISGSFQRERTAGVDPTQRSIYVDEVLVRASGESVVLPGVARSYQARFAQTDRGTFSMNVGQGSYTVTAFPTNPEVPPQTFTQVLASPDAGANLSFAFASVEGAITLAGRLIKHRLPLPAPTEVYITQAAMDLQAIDPVTSEPLSARIEVSTGRPGAKGDFILVMSPRAAQLPIIELVATPREAGAMVPSRRFRLSPPFAATTTLELGDYGEAIPMVPGRVLGLDGAPLADATVVLEGRVTGGGTFRSRLATTDADGAFLLELLPADDSYTLTVVPRPGARSGVTRQQVKVKNAPGSKPSLDPPTVTCVERVPVRGQVLLPTGAPAAMLQVRAVETSTGSRPLPLEDVDVLTDLEGRYELRLDPGSWRVEFMPTTGDLPQTSRLITVAPPVGAEGGSVAEQTFAPITLPRGRRLTGTVTTSTVGGRPSTPLANAQVRFFRVTRIEGKPAAVLLGSTVTNSAGAYMVILPSREPSRQQAR